MNNNEIRLKVVSEIKKRRNNAKLKAMFNCQKMNRNKDYLAIQNEIGKLTIDIAKARVKNKPPTEYEKRLKIARNEEALILSQCGLTVRDLEPNYTCKLCNDTGINNTKWCKCFNDLINQYSSQFNGNITYADCKQIEPKFIKAVKEITNNYANNKNICNILIAGSVGAGKTHLTLAMQSDLSNNNISTLFTSATSLNANFLEYHKCFNEEKQSYIQCYLDSDALFIDDLGTEPMLNNVTKEYLLMLISERIAMQKLTVITTNLKGNEFIQRYGERLFSRLLDKNKSLALNIVGKDLRLQKEE